MEKIIKVYKNINNENILTITTNNDTISIIGQIDRQDLEDFRTTLITAVSNVIQYNPIVIDITDSLYMNSGGFKCLIDIIKISDEHNNKVIIKAKSKIMWQRLSLQILPHVNKNLKIEWS